MARSKRLLMVLHTMLESRRDSRRVHHRLNVYRLLQHPALIRYASAAAVPSSARSCAALSTPFGQDSARSGSQPAPPGSSSSSRHNVSHAASGIAPSHCASGAPIL